MARMRDRGHGSGPKPLAIDPQFAHAVALAGQPRSGDAGGVVNARMTRSAAGPAHRGVAQRAGDRARVVAMPHLTLL
jgi:hypothetical protein